MILGGLEVLLLAKFLLSCQFIQIKMKTQESKLIAKKPISARRKVINHEEKVPNCKST